MARQGAGVAYLNVFHKDIVNFLATKKENADEKVRLKTLSLGLVVPDKYYELVAYGQPMYLFSPYDIKKEYGISMSEMDITEMYDELVSNPKIRKDKIFARELEDEISKLQQESGYPYIINIDTANRANNVFGTIKMSNLCTEIFQVQTESEINEDQTYKSLGTDISCNLSSTNVANMMDSPNFGKSIITQFRALDYVASTTSIESVPTIKHGNDLYHSVGLGALNLHGYLAKNKIMYGSPESIEFTGMYFQLLNYWTLYASNLIAKETGFIFHEFDKSKYANGEYFSEYSKHIRYKDDLSDTVKKLFENIEIPTQEDWCDLQLNIENHGLANSYRQAIAP